ncbi:MAG TPA: hypothetical protein EYN66_21515, partial [Myxococcales bacterium]|nr:hypothetical protein [Myxococcales bacterium]
MALTFKRDQIADLAINASKLDNSTITASQIALTGAFNFGSSSGFSVPTPTSTGHATTKGYVDSAIDGLGWKDSVRAATTVNGALSTAYASGQAIDGITLSTGDRILIKDQTASDDNGIYVVAASGAPVRSSDMNQDSEVRGAACFVREGTTQADTGWVCTVDTPVTIGTTALPFAQFSGGGSLVGGDGVIISGNTVSVDLKASGSGLDFAAGDLGIAAGGVTNAMLAGSIANAKLSNDAVTIAAGTALTGGGAVQLGSSVTLNVVDVGNAQIAANAGIADSKLATIAASNKVSGSAVQLADTNATLVNAGGAGGLEIKIGSTGGLQAVAAGLEAKLDGAGGLGSTASGLKVAASGVTNDMLAGSIADGKLSTIAASNKVSGSAVQLKALNKTIEDNTGLEIRFDSTGGLKAVAGGAAVKLDAGGGLSTVA